ncbi:hypothetical protein KAR91_44500 [Candidatus Pacearchaeota archaeon]|nr:hypothetical protein [Candidatus Pacearchaeota archaeon]
MARTITFVDQSIQGDKRITIADIDITSYTTDGELVTPANLGLSRIDSLEIQSTENGYMYVHDRTNSKIKVMTAAATQAANTTDTGTVRVKAEGV